jgi:hypothetical protein
MIRRARLDGQLPEGPDPEILQDIMSGVLIHRLLVDPVENTEATLRTYIEHLLVELGLLK